jgi:hypothetical protein
MQHTAESNFIIKYLREYEFIFETALAHESGDPRVLFAEKTITGFSALTVPLKPEPELGFIFAHILVRTFG